MVAYTGVYGEVLAEHVSEKRRERHRARAVGLGTAEMELPVNVFRRRRKSKLKGVSFPHIDRIKALQPFSGCEWTRELRDLSNPDKHRELQPAGVRASTSFSNSTRIDPESGEEYREYTIGATNDFIVEFLDGRPVVETLQSLLSSVKRVIDSFEGDFLVH
jgi:hypothetical protein